MSDLLAEYRSAHDEWVYAPRGPGKREALQRKYEALDKLQQAGLAPGGGKIETDNSADRITSRLSGTFAGDTAGGATAGAADTEAVRKTRRPIARSNDRPTRPVAASTEVRQTTLFGQTPEGP